MLGCGVFPDKYTFPPVIKCCTGLNNVRLGKVIQDMILEMGFDLDMFVASSFIKLYADNGCIEDARRFFDKMIDKDCVLWNVMINGYVQCGESDSAIKLFKDMMSSEAKPDSVTFACVLSISCSEAMVEYGRQLHGLVVRSGLDFDPLVGNTLVTVYSKGRQLGDARKLFDMMPQIDLVVWNRMIGGYVQNGFMDDASMLCNEMISAGIKPDSITFTSFLPSLAESSSLRQVKEIHGYIVRHGVILDVYLNSALIDLYFKCRDAVMACKIFNLSTKFDIVIYTAMISGYVLNGMNKDALEIFRWLLQKKMIPNALTFSSILPACAGLAAIKLGRELHGYITKNELEEKCPVGSAIMNMYAKCGRLDLAHLIFGRISEKDAICWNSIITSFSQDGKPEEAVYLFRQMGMEGVEDGVHYFRCMTEEYGIPAQMEHYACMADLFGRAGHLDEAFEVIKSMPFPPAASVWGTLLGACRVHGNVELAEVASRYLLDLEPKNSDIRAHYQLDQQFGDNSFDRKQDESRLPKIYPEQLVLHSHGEHYAKFGVLLEFGTEKTAHGENDDSS
ncbi:hypothetical protein D5086_022632 [Populus alba]|uniref:Uncharacterized protein n=1 Tax=Populus alba TaxID=43335 RepID=A0ACC4BFP8_POPAL